MLVGMAMEGVLPPKEIADKIENSRQYCEGYLGIRRDRIKLLNPNEIAEVLEVCGLPLKE